MNTIKTKDGTEIFYKDWGTGQPIVFHHGWPLSGDDFTTCDRGFASESRASGPYSGTHCRGRLGSPR